MKVKEVYSGILLRSLVAILLIATPFSLSAQELFDCSAELDECTQVMTTAIHELEGQSVLSAKASSTIIKYIVTSLSDLVKLAAEQGLDVGLVVSFDTASGRLAGRQHRGTTASSSGYDDLTSLLFPYSDGEPSITFTPRHEIACGDIWCLSAGDFREDFNGDGSADRRGLGFSLNFYL